MTLDDIKDRIPTYLETTIIDKLQSKLDEIKTEEKKDEADK